MPFAKKLSGAISVRARLRKESARVGEVCSQM
jgi:hypothetical protein